MLKGVDVSNHQWNLQGYGDDVDFVICKATEGIGYVDNSCDRLYQLAKSQGKLLGVYHYARPGFMGNTAEGEAEWFVQNIKGYVNEAILVLDWEAERKGDVAYAKRFLDRVFELTGVRPLFYSYESIINSYNWKDIVNGDYGLWVAKYGRDDGQPHQEPFVKDWGFYALWQYTSNGRISGFNANIDKNYFYGDRNTWLKYANAKEAQDVVIPSHKKTIEQVAQDVINGLYGSGEERYKKLTDEGYDYNAVQDKVNELVSAPKLKPVSQIVDEVIAGKWGNGQDRYNRLQKAGYNATDIQNAVNAKLGTNTVKKYTIQYGDTLEGIAKKFGTSVNRLVQINNIANKNRIFAGQVINV